MFHMNDNFHEQLITKKQKGNPLVIRIIVVVFIILFLTIGALFLGFLSIIIAVVLGVTAYFYIFPNLSVEYEYSLVNHELDITAIYSKSKRKETKELIKQLKINNPLIETNIFNSIHDVNVDTLVGYKTKGVEHSFLDEYKL